MIEEGEELEPRHQFYYGRELYYHGRNEDAVRIFETFLRDREKGAWLENLVDACRFCALCFYRMGKREEALEKLFWTFSYDVPRPQICCDIGKHFLDENRLKEFIPAIQLAVCLDRQGKYVEAARYNELASYYKPDSEAVKQNRIYFEGLK